MSEPIEPSRREASDIPIEPSRIEPSRREASDILQASDIPIEPPRIEPPRREASDILQASGIPYASGILQGNVLIVGVGGQGTILASDILAAAALDAGLDAKKSEIHGMSQRGGSVFSHVRFSEKVSSPVIPEGEADILVALEEMEAARWLGMLRPDAKILISGARILPAGAAEYPEGITAAIRGLGYACAHIPEGTIHEKAGGAKYGNLLILGLLSCIIRFPAQAWYAAIERLVPSGTFAANRDAFDAGARLYAALWPVTTK